MSWLIKPIMRPIAKRKLVALNKERDRIEAAIVRARKSKSRVSNLYEFAKSANINCHRWERWL